MPTILIVDDRPINREVLVTLLGYRGHRLLEASDGVGALALVRAERPDLVIADILMPTMDGYEFVRQLRADPAIAHTRVILCTAHYHEREARTLAAACGVAHFLFKPCEPEAVLGTVEEVLGLAREKDPLMGDAPSFSPPPTPISPEAFDREHLHLLTDKLSEKVDELQIVNERLFTVLARLEEEVGARRRMEEEVKARRQAEEALQEAVHRRDEFLAMLAHELRNPVAPILSAAQVMGLRGMADPLLENAKAIIERQVRHLARLLDDLLEVSRITRDRIELRPHRLDLSHILSDAVEASHPDIDGRGHCLLVSWPEETLWVRADRTRMVQVVTNLLKNAAKYTEPGGTIWLTLTREGSQAMIAVRDTGLGIAPELLPRIFDLFFQADRSLDRSQGGLGLGLTVAQKLVEMHRGSLTAASAGLGQGSEFVVRLPLALL
ncbi:MAG: hybrid sensor histidine kinase/response regulator [Candidatus Tectomicrobia bacterium]|uniref:histidine kinase n=1 Tax=Tectimicrobiota bacterium TaxID=2528274 RepID=A0A932FUU7_UNCTE|nr:hybrid sensor histidine kinase/response regulator [Candidatus Tectomicrobia bacterium]